MNCSCPEVISERYNLSTLHQPTLPHQRTLAFSWSNGIIDRLSAIWMRWLQTQPHLLIIPFLKPLQSPSLLSKCTAPDHRCLYYHHHVPAAPLPATTHTTSVTFKPPLTPSPATLSLPLPQTHHLHFYLPRLPSAIHCWPHYPPSPCNPTYHPLFFFSSPSALSLPFPPSTSFFRHAHHHHHQSWPRLFLPQGAAAIAWRPWLSSQWRCHRTRWRESRWSSSVTSTWRATCSTQLSGIAARTSSSATSLPTATPCRSSTFQASP